MELPLRRSTIRIREGSTHHGLTVGRSIDIVLAGQAVDIEMKIHNSVHCAGGEGCSWPVCLEYTRGDHFLITVDIQLTWRGGGDHVRVSQESGRTLKDGL